MKRREQGSYRCLSVLTGRESAGGWQKRRRPLAELAGTHKRPSVKGGMSMIRQPSMKWIMNYTKDKEKYRRVMIWNLRPAAVTSIKILFPWPIYLRSNNFKYGINVRITKRNMGTKETEPIDHVFRFGSFVNTFFPFGDPTVNLSVCFNYII